MITYYWSRNHGNFVNKMTGDPLNIPYKFDGTTREWYETLNETMIDVQLKEYGPIGNDMMIPVRCSPDVLSILESSILYRPHADPDKKILCHHCAKEIGPAPVGILSHRFSVTADNKVPKNEIHIGDFGKVIVLDINL